MNSKREKRKRANARLKATKKAKIPELRHFDLATPKKFDPHIFGYQSKSPPGIKADVPGAILALACVYNAVKDVLWVMENLKEHQPKDLTPTAFTGQWHGMFEHFNRVLLGYVKELLDLIVKHKAIFDSVEFQSILNGIEGKYRANWLSAYSAATSDVELEAADKELVSLRSLLARIRATGGFHFFTLEEFKRGYALHFDGATPHAEHAYASFGRSWETSRFYFADAALSGLRASLVAKVKEHWDKEIGELIKNLNLSVRHIVQGYMDEKVQKAKLTRQQHS